MMATSTKAKGPASVGALPSQFQNIPGKGMEMNTQTDTTSAPAPAIDLENYLHELHDMTSIASSLLEDGLGGDHQALTLREDCYHLTTRQRDLLFFAVYKVETLARRLITHFEKGEFK
jgi:hypothetical protein